MTATVEILWLEGERETVELETYSVRGSGVLQGMTPDDVQVILSPLVMWKLEDPDIVSGGEES